MKKELILPILLLFNISLFSQVNFEGLSLNEAMKKSKETGKLIFLQLESSDCLQCNEVADKAFSDKKLGELFNQIFICIKITPNHPDRENINALFNKTGGSMGSLFIASEGSLVHTFNKTTTKPDVYKEEADKALSKAGEGMRLKSMEQQYKDGNRSFGFLEFYMKTLKGFQLSTNELLDEYVTLLPNDSLKSKHCFVFIVSMTPLLESKAYDKLNEFYEVVNKKNYNFNYPLHPDIKNKIAYKSMRKAIIQKDEKYALRIALFAKNIYPKEPERAANSYDSRMLDYYIGINDTSKYLQQAANYYDKYFMQISVDSVLKKDTFNMNELAKKQPATIEKKGDSMVMRKQISYSSEAQKLSNQLSEAARIFWEFTDDSKYLTKALNWSAKALELYESFFALNNYALLLYKTGQKGEAISWQQKAIAFKKKWGLDTKTFDKELMEMK